MAPKSVERFKQGGCTNVPDRWQTDRPRYREMCRNRQNCMHHKNDST